MRGQPRNPRKAYSHQKYFKTKGKMKTFSDKKRQEQLQHHHFYTKKMLKFFKQEEYYTRWKLVFGFTQKNKEHQT